MIDQMVEEWCRQLHWCIDTFQYDVDQRSCAKLIHYFYTGQLLGAF